MSCHCAKRDAAQPAQALPLTSAVSHGRRRSYSSGGMSVSLALLAAAATSFTLPGGSPVCRMPAAARAPALIAMGAKKSKSRFGDDGTREDGVDLQGAMEAGISGGFFSNFKWGTEVDVGPKDEPKPTKKGMKKKVVGDGAGSDRGIGGNFAYRNTESARLVRAPRRPTDPLGPCASPAHCVSIVFELFRRVTLTIVSASASSAWTRTSTRRRRRRTRRLARSLPAP